jgi:hypothetical protein
MLKMMGDEHTTGEEMMMVDMSQALLWQKNLCQRASELHFDKRARARLTGLINADEVQQNRRHRSYAYGRSGKLASR